MASRNRAELIGHVGNDPEVRSTPDGSRVATFSLATSEQWTDATGNKREKTEWHRVVVWNRGQRTLADLVERYVHKGDQVAVDGTIRYRQWQDKDDQTRHTTEIDAREVLFLTSKREKIERQPAGAGVGADADDLGRPDDDDLPF